MSRTAKVALASLAAAGAGLAAADVQAQWGYGARPQRSHFHAPYASRSSSFSYQTVSQYSLYGPMYPPAAGPAFGYQMAYPSQDFGGYSGYGPSPVMASPAYGYGVYSGPSLRAPHGKVEYDVYGPRGKQEVEYKFRRDGSVSVDLDD